MQYGPELVHYMTNRIKKFTGRKVQKIDAFDNCAILSFSGKENMLLSWDSRFCGISEINETEKKELLLHADSTPSIINSLKSNLLNSVIKDIYQINRDKLVCIEFRKTIGMGFYHDRKVILELTERYSNILLLDENDTIIETCKHIYPETNQYRTILPGIEYKCPPELHGISIENWLEAPDVSSVSKIKGLGKKLTQFISSYNLPDIINIIGQYYSDNYDSMKTVKIKNYFTVVPDFLSDTDERYRTPDIFKDITFMSIHIEKLNKKKKEALKLIARETLRRERQIKDIEKLMYSGNEQKYKDYGDAIVSNLWKIKTGDTSAELTYYSEEGKECNISVPLRPEISPSKNAEAYFKKYKKIINAQKNASIILDKVTEELNFLYEEDTLIKCADNEETINNILSESGLEKKISKKQNTKKDIKTAEVPYRKIDLEDSIIYFGLSARGNRYVSFKLADSDDLWFHAQGIPGTHVILRMTRDIDEERKEFLINLCSSIAVNYSKSADGNRIRVDYTNKKFISPIKGEIAGVTYKNFKTIFNDSNFYQEFLSENQ